MLPRPTNQASNIDRLLAIWQTLNSKSWFVSDASPPAGDPLPPFHHRFQSGAVDYFSSDDLRIWTQYGYQYDVLQRIAGESDADYISRIKTYVDTTYRNTGQILLRDNGNLFKDIYIQDDTYDDYLIDVLYDRYGGQKSPVWFPSADCVAVMLSMVIHILSISSSANSLTSKSMPLRRAS